VEEHGSPLGHREEDPEASQAGGIYHSDQPWSWNDPKNIALEWIRPGARVLDVGCATGRLAGALKEKGCTVFGIEPDPRAAPLAREVLERLFEVDADDLPSLGSAVASCGELDYVVATDVLEHLAYPLPVLRTLVESTGGRPDFIVSLPNIAHWWQRLRLLFGRFGYGASGILDETHLHLFTRRTSLELLERGGLDVKRTAYTVSRRRSRAIAAVRPELVAVQFVFLASARAPNRNST
jgi:SAM-dependent methyltransferase